MLSTLNFSMGVMMDAKQQLATAILRAIEIRQGSYWYRSYNGDGFEDYYGISLIRAATLADPELQTPVYLLLSSNKDQAVLWAKKTLTLEQ